MILSTLLLLASVNLLTVIVVLAVVGLVLWLVTEYIPMNTTIKRILIAVVVFIVVIWLLQIFGLIGSLTSVHT